MIPFNVPTQTGNESQCFNEFLTLNKFSGDGFFTKKCTDWFDNHLNSTTLLTTSCTHALELAAILLDIKDGDEVIMPSYTFVSTANAFLLRGAKIVFVDIRPDTMNIDETLIEEAITPRTKVIVPVHYAGVACEMDTIMNIANEYNLFVVEDAAQGMMSSYKGKRLGTIGDLGAFSFHETKNYQCGEGGLLIVNNPSFLERAKMIREKGTNRSLFLQGVVDKYTWVDIGSSYLPSDLNAMFLFPQLEMSEHINEQRLKIWYKYSAEFKELEKAGHIELPSNIKGGIHNAHMFYIKVRDIEERTALMLFLRNEGVSSVFHYIPLHSSPYGSKHSVFSGCDKFTTSESERLLRLPIFYGMQDGDVVTVCQKVKAFFNEN